MKIVLSLFLPISTFGGAIYWSSPTANPVGLPLAGAAGVSANGQIVAGGTGTAAATYTLGASSLVTYESVVPGAQIARRVNNLGQVLVETSASESYFVNGGTATKIPSYGRDMNEAGQVVGQTIVGNSQAFIWSSAFGLSGIGGAYTYVAEAVNGFGQSACLNNPPPFTTTTLGVCQGATFSSVGYTGSLSVLGINDNLWIVGWTSGSGGSDSYVFRLGTGVTILSNFVAADVNNANQILGYRTGAGGVIIPTIFSFDTGFTNLPTLGYTDLYPRAFTDGGQIIGNSLSALPSVAPVPEPATFATTGLVVIALAALRRRRQAA